MGVRMLDKEDVSMERFHLAGIVPVAGQPLNFRMPWHDSMMPIAADYLAVERAVHECATMGCETIWIVAPKDMQPLLRKRIGEWVRDFKSKNFKYYAKYPSMHEKQVPIYYVPIHPKDQDKRDCLSWSIIYGALRCFDICSKISKWTVASKYYVAFPYGVYNTTQLAKHASLIGKDKNLYLSHNGKTVRDGEYLGFTFDKEGFVEYRKIIRTGTGAYKGQTLEELARLPLEERYSARFFSLDKVFGSAIIEGQTILDIPQYDNIDSWEGYCKYMGSENRRFIKRPNYDLQYHEFSKIGGNE